jgi:hypothetical protein
MKTARELLFDKVTELLAKPPDDGTASTMKKIMARYRVQTKPGVDIGAGVTARDALGDGLIELWRAGGNDDDTKAKMGTLIDQFRMQLKQNGSDKPAPAPRVRPVPQAPKVAPTPPKKPTPADAPPSRASVAHAPTVSLGIAEAPARRPEPVAGGPRTRKKARGECPKCKSMGVVLARSYSGDEYYSCIYCGWQAYRPSDDDDPNASLAVRLLGQTLGSD